jgi:hypothetical protein
MDDFGNEIHWHDQCDAGLACTLATYGYCFDWEFQFWHCECDI